MSSETPPEFRTWKEYCRAWVKTVRPFEFLIISCIAALEERSKKGIKACEIAEKANWKLETTRKALSALEKRGFLRKNGPRYQLADEK